MIPCKTNGQKHRLYWIEKPPIFSKKKIILTNGWGVQAAIRDAHCSTSHINNVYHMHFLWGLHEHKQKARRAEAKAISLVLISTVVCPLSELSATLASFLRLIADVTQRIILCHLVACIQSCIIMQNKQLFLSLYRILETLQHSKN